LVMSTTPGQDSNTGDGKVRGMRNFGNKIWNAGRFVKDLGSKTTDDRRPGFRVKPGMTNNTEFKKRIETIKQELTRLLEDNRVGLAAEYVYNEFWHWFCDEQIEENKQGKISDDVLKDGFKSFLVMLHPFVPFVTEAVWKEVFIGDGMLISQSWPI
ncbi:MAG: Valine-tRNA ligase, partial [Microgenomates group bacterium GW2011_GWC1_44_10]